MKNGYLILILILIALVALMLCWIFVIQPTWIRQEAAAYAGQIEPAITVATFEWAKKHIIYDWEWHELIHEIENLKFKKYPRYSWRVARTTIFRVVEKTARYRAAGDPWKKVEDFLPKDLGKWQDLDQVHRRIADISVHNLPPEEFEDARRQIEKLMDELGIRP